MKDSAPGGRNVAFATCKDLTCAGGGIILNWTANCEFCARPIKEGTVSYPPRLVTVVSVLGLSLHAVCCQYIFWGVFNCLFAYKPTLKSV